MAMLRELRCSSEIVSRSKVGLSLLVPWRVGADERLRLGEVVDEDAKVWAWVVGQMHLGRRG
jgi:hypothetical protein